MTQTTVAGVGDVVAVDGDKEIREVEMEMEKVERARERAVEKER